MKLYFSRNPNPRLAVAVAKHVGVNVDLEFAAPKEPSHASNYYHLNPNLLLPILEGPKKPLWEADAVACYLSRRAATSFWRIDEEEPEMIRWLSWGKENFVQACDIVHWERGTKPRYGLGVCDEREVERGLDLFHKSANLLDAELKYRDWLVGDLISYADFRMATFLPFNDVARVPIERYPSLSRWYARLEDLEHWRDPFMDVYAPDLPPLPTANT